ncbi:hypothetical protein ACHAQJ_008527 [Trichoderma viride]
MAQDEDQEMAKTPPQSYLGEVHDIYLGKNRRLADPIFFPAPDLLRGQVQRLKRLYYDETEETSDGLRSLFTGLQECWGCGIVARHPPGGPFSLFQDYKKAMEAMTFEIYSTWNKIQDIVRNHELVIQEWVLSQERVDGQWPTKHPFWAILEKSWKRTTADFNDCDPNIKKFMEAKYTESDFQIEPPNIGIARRFPLFFLLRFFQQGESVLLWSRTRPIYDATYNHSANFYEPRNANDWPHETEPELFPGGTYTCNGRGSRKFFKKNRLSFLVPHIASYELLDPVHLLSFVHYRGRYHPSVFTKLDNDMTYIGRRTNYLTGPMLPNCMVSFDPSGSEYHPKFWKGWGGEKGDKRPMNAKDAEAWDMAAEEYDDLWHRGQLFGTSEAWIMLQNQRATYLYTLNVLTSICCEVNLSPTALVTPKPAQERELIFSKTRIVIDALQKKRSNNVIQFAKQTHFLLPPTQISSVYFRELEFRIQAAELRIQELFNDPGYFFDRIHELRGHHWGYIGRKNDAENPDTSDSLAIYMEKYTDQPVRHTLYFDLIRGVLRRSVFEFYMWHSIYVRLQEFENMLATKFADYGKKDASDSDGTGRLQQPPLLLSEKKRREHDVIAEKYLSLVTLIRYHAVFFVNEFRKKGLHAGTLGMRNLTFTIGDTHKDTQGLQCKGKKKLTQEPVCRMEKKHYGAPDLIYRSKLAHPGFGYDKLNGNEDQVRLFVFENMESFIASPMDCTMCGIKEASAFLQDVAQSPTGGPKYLGEPVLTDLLERTIDGLNILSTLADHLESMWSAMDIIGGAAADENLRRKYFNMGSKDISINFLDFDAFDFDDKIPKERLERLFLFFDELQGFSEESVSMGHARGDLKRFGASLLCKLIYPLNSESGSNGADQEAIVRLEQAMGVSRDNYPFVENEKPFNLDQEEARRGETVPLVSQPQTYRHIAAHEKGLDEERQYRRDKLVEELAGPSKAEQAREKRRLKKLARRHDKARQRLRAAGELLSEDEDDGKDESDAKDGKAPARDEQNNLDDLDEQKYLRWGESLHATLKQFSLPPVPATRILPEPQVPGPAFSASHQPAPDGLAKNVMKKKDWATLESIYVIHGSANAAVSYAQVSSAMSAMGYVEVGGRGGSHMNFVREEGRWPHTALPRGENIQLASTHGMKSAAAGKAIYSE